MANEFHRTSKCPCYKCEDRTWDCKLDHKCERYEAWRKAVHSENDTIYANKRKEREVDMYTYAQMKKIHGRRRKK